jgi:hypothetical protein
MQRFSEKIMRKTMIQGAMAIRPKAIPFGGAIRNFFQAGGPRIVLIFGTTYPETTMIAIPTDFPTVLHADGPDPERAEALKLYGRFVGDWDTEVIAHGPDGTSHHTQGEIHFGWVLQGRAIQDVWMIPRLADRTAAPQFPIAGNWYGTTLRVYDPTIEAWRIFWIDPARSVFRQQIGRAHGEDIVQEGSTESGELSRWSFTKITENSFHWLGEARAAEAANWRLVVEVKAKRRSRG